MRGILLDLDDTLLDNKGAMARGFSEFCATYRHQMHGLSEKAALARWHEIADRHWARYETGELSFQQQRRCRVREYLDEDLDDRAADAAYLIYQRGYESGWRLLPGVSEFLAQVLDIPKLIVTNGDRDVQLEKIRVTRLDLHVIGVVTPADCGHCKPDLEIFEAAINLLQLDARDCLMIGDDHARDIAPAIQLGMPHFHLRPGGTLLDALVPA